MPVVVRSLALWACLATIPSAAQAQSRTSALRLDEAFALVEAQLPSVEVGRAAVREAQAALETTRAAWVPSALVEAQATLTHNQFPVPASGGPRSLKTSQTNLGVRGIVEWTVVDFGRRRATVRAARASRRQSRADLGDTLRLAKGFVLQTYLLALAAQQRLDNELLTVERRTTLLATIEALAKAGVRPRADAVFARVDLVAAQQRVHVREVELAAAQSALASAVGWDPATRAEPVPLQSDYADQDTSPQNASRTAVAMRPDLAFQRQLVERARGESAAAARALAPEGLLRGEAALDRVDQRTDTGTSGKLFDASGSLVVRWAGLDMTAWRQAKQARRSAQTAQHQYEAKSLRVRTEAAQAAYETQRAEAALAQAHAVAEAARVNRKTQTERYEAGAASLIERLEAESAEQRSREQLVEAALTCDLAHARLWMETDRLDEALTALAP